jgi:hypothetical protein
LKDSEGILLFFAITIAGLEQQLVHGASSGEKSRLKLSSNNKTLLDHVYYISSKSIRKEATKKCLPRK